VLSSNHNECFNADSKQKIASISLKLFSCQRTMMVNQVRLPNVDVYPGFPHPPCQFSAMTSAVAAAILQITLQASFEHTGWERSCYCIAAGSSGPKLAKSTISSLQANRYFLVQWKVNFDALSSLSIPCRDWDLSSSPIQEGPT
jgi:hypothetical protein